MDRGGNAVRGSACAVSAETVIDMRREHDVRRTRIARIENLTQISLSQIGSSAATAGWQKGRKGVDYLDVWK